MMPVTFIWPLALFSLALVPVFAIVYGLLQVRRRRIIAQYGNLGLLQNVSGQRLGFVRHLPAIFLLAGLTLLLIAAARPEMQVRLPRVEGTVILAFDVSGSMAADDMKPNRMEAAKAAAREFVQQQPATVQIGIVAFSDSGFSVQAPSNDKDAVLSSIGRLSPQRGTSLANGILVSLKAIATANDDSTHFYSPLTPGGTATPTPVPAGQYDSSVIVLLTDGENNEQPDPMVAAKAAVDRGVRVYTVGLGSPTGTMLHINGFTVHTQLDEQMLQQIAQATGGAYYNATSAKELTQVYANLDPQLVVKPEKIEVTSMFAGASAILLLLGGLLSLLWFSRLP
jgi:Ca-activated chloride channel family protein